jgi:hypothetical protein
MIQLEYCTTDDHVVDMITQAPPRAKFELLQTMFEVTVICIKEEC